MKLYDFDGMFDEKLSEYISKNAGKYSEDEWEDIIPKLYQKFGDTKIKSLGKTPREFYAEMTDSEIIRCLKAHLRENVPVSEFLCNEIEGRNLVESLLPMLDKGSSECEYAMNIIGSDDRAIKKYLNILVSTDDTDLKNRCVDLIKEKADLVVEEAIEFYENGVEREYMCEILSRSVIRDDRIFEILIKEFRGDVENVSMHASYLAAYGDERALQYLLDKIDEEGIPYTEYRELKFAIEALGGEYEKERDFSSDPYYQLFSGQSPETADLFASFINAKKV